nr:MAG TPA: hypothetical protein [Caudoviricetes sp.]
MLNLNLIYIDQLFHFLLQILFYLKPSIVLQLFVHHLLHLFLNMSNI